ncbi:MAG: outer membrane protein assembly factor BamB family protein, partial [Planctomycetota bacterium]
EREFFTADPALAEPVLATLPEGIEKNVLSLMKGEKPLNEVIQELSLPSFKVFGIVNKYIQDGLVRPLKIDELRDGAKSALDREDLVAALAFLRRAFDRKRDDPEVVEEIASLFEYAAELPLAAAFQEFLAALHVKRGAMHLAEQAWEKSVTLHPDNLDVLQRLFQRRLQSGSMQKALETGMLLVTHALEDNEVALASQTLEVLLRENPKSFAIRRKVFEMKVHERDVTGALGELTAMEKIASADPSQAGEARFLPAAYQTLARLDPENPEIQKKLNAMRKAKAKALGPKRKSVVPVLVAVLLLLGGLAAVVHFVVLPEGFQGLLKPAPVKVEPNRPPPPPPDPNAQRRTDLLEEARGLSVSGVFEKSIAKYEEALTVTPKGHKARPAVEKELEAVRKSWVQKRESEFGAALAEQVARTEEAVKTGYHGSEAEVAKARGVLKEVDQALAEMKPYCPASSLEAYTQARDKVAEGLTALDERIAAIFVLRGELEWDKEVPDTEIVKRFLRKAIEKSPRGESAKKARERIEAVDRYMADAAQAYAEGERVLGLARKEKTSFRVTLLNEALMHKRKVFRDYPKAPVASRVLYPLWIETSPDGAVIRIEGKPETFEAPVLLTYPAAEGITVVAEKPGFVAKRVRMDGSSASLRLDLERGFLLRVEAGGRIDRGPAGDDKRVAFGCRDGGLYVYLHQGAGKPKKAWSPYRVNDIGGIKSTPLMWRRKVLFSSANFADVFALDALSGKRLWGPFRPARMVDHTPVSLPDSPYILVGDMGGTLYALQGDSGEIAWKSTVTPREGIRSAPGLFPAQGAVIVGTTKGSLVKVRVKDGKVLWRAKTGIGAGVTPVMAGNRVLAVARSHVFLFDAASDSAPAAPQWSKRAFSDYSLPAFDGRRFHLTNRNGKYQILRVSDGREEYSLEFAEEGKNPVSPLVIGDRVVLAAGRSLVCLRIRGGAAERVWKLEAPGAINNPMVHRGGKIFLTTSSGHFCIVLLD